MRCLIAIALLLSGCVLNSDKYPRPRDLTPTWKTPSLRLLAIQPSPPEIAPGETATFTYLAADPNGEVGGVVWTACAPEDTTAFGCAIDFSAFGEDATPDDLAQAGVIGIEPGFPPEFTAPDDALDTLEEDERLEGLQYTAQALILPPEGLDDEAELDFASFETGYKRVVVSEATTPNANPTIQEFTVDGQVVGVDAVTEVDPSQELELGIVIPDEAVEEYEYINPDGELELRVEEPFANWFSTDGAAMEDTTLHPFTQADWTAPETSGLEGTWFVVVRDRRGGIAWEIRQWRIR